MYFKILVATTSYTIGMLGYIIIVYGAILGFVNFIRMIFKSLKCDIVDIRILLNKYYLLGLDFIIGKDITLTFLDQSWEGLTKIGVLILIRIVLSLFIEYEFKNISKKSKLLKH